MATFTLFAAFSFDGAIAAGSPLLATNAAPKARASGVWFDPGSSEGPSTARASAADSDMVAGSNSIGSTPQENRYVSTAGSMARTAFLPLFVCQIPASMVQALYAKGAAAPLTVSSLSGSGEAGKTLTEAFAATILMTSLLLPPLPVEATPGVDTSSLGGASGNDTSAKIANLIEMWKKNQLELEKIVANIDGAAKTLGQETTGGGTSSKPQKSPLEGLDDSLDPKVKKPVKTVSASEKPKPVKKKKVKKVVKAPAKPKPSPAGEWQSFEATAYCSCSQCCGKSDGITASGKKTHWGTLAVPSSIPFGRKYEIRELPGMVFVAEDRGGAIKGGRIDIWHPSHSKALAFGRRPVKMRVVK